MIREQVVALRGERLDQMPYLDKGYIKDVIRKETVQSTLDFISKGEKSLEDVVERAVLVHTPAVAAKERIALSKRRILVAVRDFFPEVSYKMENKDGRIGSVSGMRGYLHNDWRLTMRQPIFRGGILWNTFLKERNELKAAKSEYEQVVSDLMKDVAAAYFEYHRAKHIVEDTAETLNGEVKKQAEISSKKWEQGLIAEIEYLNVQSLYSEMQFDYETMKQELEIAKLELQKYLDLQQDDAIEIEDLYENAALIRKEKAGATGGDSLEAAIETAKSYGVFQGEKVPALDELIDMAYLHRPELQVESARLRSARLEQKMKMGDFLPEANLVMEVGQVGESYIIPNGRDPDLHKEFRLFLELSWNALGNTLSYNFENDERGATLSSYLGDQGSQMTRNSFKVDALDQLGSFVDIKQAQVDKLDQVAKLEEAEKNVIKEVKEAFFDYNRALIQLRSALKSVNYRTRMTQLSLHKLENREIESSEYMQAETDLLEEKQELHKALADYFTARVKLNHAVGIRGLITSEGTHE
ncbi:MAG: TolC family protein [Candidatus Omnitrophota bacterium]